MAVAGKKQLYDAGPRGTGREGTLSMGGGERAEGTSKSKSFMKSKNEAQRDPKSEHAEYDRVSPDGKEAALTSPQVLGPLKNQWKAVGGAR